MDFYATRQFYVTKTENVIDATAEFALARADTYMNGMARSHKRDADKRRADADAHNCSPKSEDADL